MVRAKSSWVARWPLFGAMVLLACENAGGDETHPRAAAAVAAQQVAAGIEHAFAPLAPLIPTLFGDDIDVAVQQGLGSTFRALGSFDLAERHWLRAQQRALARGDAAAAAAAEIPRCELALLIGDYVLTEKLANHLAQLAESSHLPTVQGSVEEYLGVVDRRHGELDSAVMHEQRALDLQAALGDERGVARALSNLGTIARDRGDFAHALDLQLQSLAIRERVDEYLELTLRNLALIYRDLGDDAMTRKYFTRSIEVATRHGDYSNYASTLGTYASYLVDVGEFAPALAAADEALAVARVVGNRPAVGFDLLDSGRALVGLGRLAEATARLRQALDMGSQLDQQEIVARSLVALSEAVLDGGDRPQAHKLLDQSFMSVRANQYKPVLAQAYALAERLAASEGQSMQALDFAHKRAALREELLGTRANRRLSLLESQYAKAASEQQLALATRDNQLQAARLQQQQSQRNFGIAVVIALCSLLGMLAWRFFGVRELNRALNVRNAEIEAQRSALSEANQRLESQSKELYQAAITDPLTGIFNRGHLMRQLDARLIDCTRSGDELALLLLDFDHFKQINDARGHLFGDRVLIAGVQTLRQWLEPGDLLGRYGGEEFIAAVVGRDLAAVRALAESLRIHVAETLATLAPELKVIATVSIGVALRSQMPEPVRLEALIEAADKAVYTAKANGRNRVINYAA
jgi:diguanylate cyclase (GGDEF)-like protein